MLCTILVSTVQERCGSDRENADEIHQDVPWNGELSWQEEIVSDEFILNRVLRSVTLERFIQL